MVEKLYVGINRLVMSPGGGGYFMSYIVWWPMIAIHIFVVLQYFS